MQAFSRLSSSTFTVKREIAVYFFKNVLEMKENRNIIKMVASKKTQCKILA